MRKLIFIFFLFLPSLAHAQPSIAFKSETHDFGVVGPGSYPEHVFEFENTGTEELVIEKLEPS